MNTSAEGQHFLIDCFDCDLSVFCLEQSDVDSLRVTIDEQIRSVGLTPLGSSYHYFGPRAVTAVICLAESHIAFHSWPEQNLVRMDIYVCNYSQDNSQAAEQLLEYFGKRLFGSERLEVQCIKRS